MGMSDNKTFFKKAEMQQLTVRDLFSDVLRKHTPEENARLFQARTPDEASMLSQWMKPYMFARVLAVGVLLCVVSYFLIVSTGNNLLMPFLFMAGSFLVPIVIMLFFWEINIPRNISFPTIIFLFFVGGILSLVFTSILNNFLIRENLFIYTLSVGVAEETAKILASIVWLKKSDKKYILNGMLVGAAVGAGFDAIETAGYVIVNAGWSLSNMLMRAITAPGGHMTWGAISGGALMAAKGKEELKPEHFLNPFFLKWFAFCILTHGLWDFLCGMEPLLIVFLVPVIVFGAYVVLKKGLNEIVETALRHNQDSLTRAIHREGAAAAGFNGGSGSYYLQGVAGAFTGRRYHLESTMRIGRDSSQCSIAYPGESGKGVSRCHCELMMQQGRPYIRDIGSSYGTFLNGKRLSKGQIYPLSSGDMIMVGSQKEQFRIIN